MIGRALALLALLGALSAVAWEAWPAFPSVAAATPAPSPAGSPSASPVATSGSERRMCVVWLRGRVDGYDLHGVLGLNLAPDGRVEAGVFIQVGHGPLAGWGNSNISGQIAGGTVELFIYMGDGDGLTLTGTADRDVGECAASPERDFPMHGTMTLDRACCGEEDPGVWITGLGSASPPPQLSRVLAEVHERLQCLDRGDPRRC